MLDRIKKAESELTAIQRAVHKMTNEAEKEAVYDDIRERVFAIQRMRDERLGVIPVYRPRKPRAITALVLYVPMVPFINPPAIA